MLRVRLGIILIVLSWVPFAQVFIYIAHNNNKLMSEDSANEFRLVMWCVQIAIGLVGLWLVGKVAIQMAKQDGWKKTPAKIWHLFRSGDQSN